MAGLVRMVKNLGAAMTGRALTIVPQVILPPIFAYRYSTGMFGEWGVLSGAVGALSFLNFGVQTYMNQDLAVRYNRGELEGYRQRQSTAVRLLLGIVITASILGLSVFFMPIDHWLRLDLGRFPSQLTIYFMGLQVLTTILLGYITGIYLGVQLAHRGAMWSNLNTALMAAFLLLGVIFKLSFPILAASQILAFLITAPVVLIDLKRKAPDLFPRLDFWSTQIAREILAPSGYFGLISMSTFLTYQVPLVILQRALGPVAVASFIIMRTLFSMCRQILAMFSQAMSTEITTLFARRDHPGLLRLYDYSERLLFFIIPLANTTTLMLAPVLVKVWMRKSPELFSPWPYVLAAAISMAISLKEHKYYFQAATNTHEDLARIMFFSYLAMAPLATVAVHYYGVVGFLWVWLFIELIQVTRITWLNVRLFEDPHQGATKLDFINIRRLIYICVISLVVSLLTLVRTASQPMAIQIATAAAFTLVTFAAAFPLFRMKDVVTQLATRFKVRIPGFSS
jgi:O-antigen/teichoic acid export membrane protein